MKAAKWSEIVAHPYFVGKTDEEKLNIARNYFSKNFDPIKAFQEKAQKDPEYRNRVWRNFVSKAIPPEKWKIVESDFVQGLKRDAAASMKSLAEAIPTGETEVPGTEPEAVSATVTPGAELSGIGKGFARLGYETFSFIPRIIPAGLAGLQDLIAKGPDEAKKTIEQGMSAASSETVFGEMGNVERAVLEVAITPFKTPEAATEFLREQFPEMEDSPIASTVIQTGLELALVLAPFRGVIRRGIQQSRLYRIKAVSEWPKEEVAKVLGSAEERASVEPALQDAFSRLSRAEKVSALKKAGIRIEDVSPSVLGRVLGAKGGGRGISTGRGSVGEPGVRQVDRGGILPEPTEAPILPESPKRPPEVQAIPERAAILKKATEPLLEPGTDIPPGSSLVAHGPPPMAVPSSAVEPVPPSQLPVGEARPPAPPSQGAPPVSVPEEIATQIEDLSLAMSSWEAPAFLIDPKTGGVSGRTKSTYPKWFKQTFPNDTLKDVSDVISKWKREKPLGKKERRILSALVDIATQYEQEGTSLAEEGMRGLFSFETKLSGLVDEMIGDVTPQPGLSVRSVGGEGGPSYTEKDYKFDLPESERRYKKAHGLKEVPLPERARAIMRALWNKASREYEHLPRTAEFAELRYALLNLRKQKGISSDRAVRALQGVTSGFNPTRMGLFERRVLINDLVQELAKGRDIPFGLDAVSLPVEDVKTAKLVASDPVVRNALRLREQYLDTLRGAYAQAMADIGLDVSKRFGNKDYYRHQVIEYANLKGVALSGAGKKLKTPASRSFLKRRAGDTRDINTNYLEAEFEVVSQMLHDIEVAKVIKVVDDGYNMLEPLKEEAKEVGAKWQDIVPEGYRVWQPRQGNVFFLSDSIPAKLAEQLRSGMMEEIGVTEEDLRQVLSVGGRRRQFVLKNEVADTIDNLVRNRPQSALLGMDKELLNAWKRWQLVSPRRFAKYQFRNLTGDAEAMFLGNPSAFRKAPRAVRELYQVFAAEKGMTETMRIWFQLGGFETTLQAQEMGEINKFRAFRHVRDEKIPVAGIPKWAFKEYWRKVRLATDFRESVLRYAAFLDYREQMLSNPEGMPRNFGASIPEEIKAIPSIDMKAFVLSNQLLGAYDQVGVMGQHLRNHLFPFWSWQEVNFKRYIQLAKNAYNDGDLATAVGRKVVSSVIRSPYTAWRIGKFLLGATAFWATLQVYNNLMWPEEERELPDEIRARPHIIFGRKEKGEIVHFSRIGMLGDFLEWFGLDKFPLLVDQWASGKTTLKEITEEIAKSPENKFAQGVTPAIKTPVEMLTKQALFPDAFRPRMIRDRGYHVAKSFGLEHEYTSLMKLPSEGYNKSLINYFVYTTDPGQSAYGDTVSDRFRFLEKIGKGGEGFFMSPKSNALYNLKLAVRLKDRDAVGKYSHEYKRLGGTSKGLNASLAAMHPLAGLSPQEKLAFIDQLGDNGRRKLVQAIHFYYNVLLGGKGEEE